MTVKGTKHMNSLVFNEKKHRTHFGPLTDTEAQWTIYQRFTERFEEGRQTCTQTPFDLDKKVDSLARWFSHFSFPNGWKLLPTWLRQKSGHHVHPNQQQYKRLVYLNMRDCTKLYAAQMCPHPQTEVMYGDLALERHYEELIWKAAHIWNFERCSPDLLNRVHFQSLQRGEFNSSGLPRTNITACIPSPNTHISSFLHHLMWIFCGREIYRHRAFNYTRSCALLWAAVKNSRWLRLFQLQLVSLLANYCHLCWFLLKRVIISLLLNPSLPPNQLTWVILGLLEACTLPQEEVLPSAGRMIA